MLHAFFLNSWVVLGTLVHIVPSYRTFLSCLPPVFGLKETDLFQPSHLYDYTDFARVLHTLSKLSNCVKAKARSVPGFPQQPRIASSASMQGDDAPLVEQEEEAQIYRTLEELVTEDNYKEFYYQVYVTIILISESSIDLVPIL